MRLLFFWENKWFIILLKTKSHVSVFRNMDHWESCINSYFFHGFNRHHCCNTNKACNMMKISKLKDSPSQFGFNEPISGRHIRKVLPNTHLLVVPFVFKIIGKEFIMNNDQYWVSSDISSILVSMTCLVEVDKGNINTLNTRNCWSHNSLEIWGRC